MGCATRWRARRHPACNPRLGDEESEEEETQRDETGGEEGETGGDDDEKENENENENVFREENEKKPRENIGDVFFVRLVSIFLRARSCTRGGTVEACGDFGGDERTKS